MRAFCIHTVHYTAAGTTGVTVAPAGAIVTDLADKDFDELGKLGSVRTPTEADEVNYEAALKRHGGKLPGARSPLPKKVKAPADGGDLV